MLGLHHRCLPENLRKIFQNNGRLLMKPTRITSRSQTLIDNIFYNELHSNIVAGNITTDTSDHLTQFVAIPGDWHTEIKNQEIYRRNYKNLNSDKIQKKLQ